MSNEVLAGARSRLGIQNRGRVILRDVAEGMQERVSSFDWFQIVF